MPRKSRNSTAPTKVAGKEPKAAESVLPPDDRSPEQRFGDSIRTSGQRETVEAFVVAFVLALLFRAFVAEAFVIPTGSMAPTLMGAHKDIECDQCNQRFQVGASKERRGPNQDDSVVACICPNCRVVNNLDLAGNRNDATFNGDRILVSKFAYTLSNPERWDVIVFKFPGNPKQNYIKRLVGLPEEALSIQHGDIFVAPQDGSRPEVMVQKPADKLLAMKHHVYDTDHQSDLLIKAGYPSRFQPWREGAVQPPADSWQVERSEDGLVATVDPGDQSETHWLRYFHRWPTDIEWDAAANGRPLNSVDPYSSRLITDFYAYDCYITVSSGEVYQQTPSNARMSRGVDFEASYESGGPLSQFGGRARFGERGFADEGLHWVGDLIVESDVQPSGECKELLLELIEAGVQYQCRIDLETGVASLAILDGEQSRPFSGGAVRVEGVTTARAGNSFSVRYSNCDDQLLLWVNNKLIEFDGPTVFDARQFRPSELNYPRYQKGSHPLDASPVGIAVRGGAATIDRVRIDRDKYYVATDNSSFGIFDYDMNALISAQRDISFRDIQQVMADPDAWEQFPGWQTRRKVTFELQKDQFFPMGDNSPESLDARCWAGTKLGARLPDRFRDQAYAFAEASYVPRDLLVGKALVVFWPHPWNAPIPFTPNFDRFRLIR
jgi:signal peptidase I